jgi:hypothetical protein
VSSGRLKGQAAFHQHHDWVTVRVLRQADQPGLLGGSLSERLLQELSRSGLAVHEGEGWSNRTSPLSGWSRTTSTGAEAPAQ